MMTYIARQEMRHETDIGPYEAYDIVAIDGSDELAFVEDVCNDREEAQRLAEMMNENQLEFCHFECFLEDYVIYHSLD